MPTRFSEPRTILFFQTGRRCNEIYKGYKIRIYPTKEQETLMRKHSGCCRYIWNHMLALQEERYKNGEKHLSAFKMINLLTPLKHDGEHDWLNEISTTSLQIICQDLNKAYKMYFEKISNKPRFKCKKKAKVSFPVDQRRFYFKSSEYVQILKFGKVKYKTDFTLPIGREHKFTNPRISYVNGKWILSFNIECESQARELTDKSMGIDLGIKKLAVVSYGDEQLVFDNINKSKKMKYLNKQLKHIQRSISRKYESNRQGRNFIKTNNIAHEQAKLRKLYARIANIRMNYLHQTTHKLVELLPYRIVMEDLNITGMMKNKHLAKAIGEQCWYEFTRQIQYKCERNGIEFIQVDKFYPSSKTCSCCGAVKEVLKLSERTYVCEKCGTVIDRDYNAAINLSRYVA